MRHSQLAQSSFPSLSKKDYERDCRALQIVLMRCQQFVHRGNKRVLIVLEGTDASGKGGVIKRLTYRMDPRGVSVYPIGPPSETERAQHFLDRFRARLPKAGEIAILDRTWYGRVLVEAIEYGLSVDKVESAYRDIGAFEQQLLDEGVLLIKLFLHISFDEQTRRLLERLNNPLKQWKLTEADLESRHYWRDYQIAYQSMLDRDYRGVSPWHVIPANHKKYARVEAMQCIAQRFEEYFGEIQAQTIDHALKARFERALNPLV